MDQDWQNSLTEIKDRGQYLLHSEKWADCHFLVGTPPHQRLIAGHKLILAMASPVFERMFYGNLPDKTDPIIIPDVQPEAFESMLEYMYTDRITITSFDKACELCYVGKKYMLPHVVTRCTHYLWADLSPKNACRAYEFAKLFDEPRLMQSSMDLIAANTREVLYDSSFLDIEESTLMAILDQNRLNIDSELDLFNCLLKFANENGNEEDAADNGAAAAPTDEPAGHDDTLANEIVEEIKMEPDVAAMVQHMHHEDEIENNFDHVVEQQQQQPPTASSSTSSSNANVSAVVDDVVIIDSDASSVNANDELNVSAGNMINLMDAQRSYINGAVLRQAVKKIRFLTMTPQQFAEGPARSKLLHQHEALAILIKISSPSLNDCDMPEGFCASRSSRNFYESHRQRDLTCSYRHSNSNTGSSTSACFPGTAARSSGITHNSSMTNQSLFGRSLNLSATLQRTSVPLNLGSHIEPISLPINFYADENPMAPCPRPEPINIADNPVSATAAANNSSSSSSGAANVNLRCFNDSFEANSSNTPTHNDNETAASAAAAAAAAGSHNDMLRSYCMRSMTRQFDYRNTSVTDCGVTFQVDTNIWILGVQVPTQVLCGELMTAAGFTERYTEVLYAHIQDMHGSRIAYTHCTARVRYDSLLDITLDRPVYIYRNQIYKVYVVFNKTGWYPMYSSVPDAVCHRVKFMFNVGNPTESVRDGLIYAIIFSTPQDHARLMID